jgi:23S rRNA (pseudouridine1915-N3)-methyltransferase
MKLHIITIGKPKLDYAKLAWDEYLKRLGKYHNVKVTNIPDKQNNAKTILISAVNSFKVALVIDSKELTSLELAEFLDTRAQSGKTVSFLIGGPEGLPKEVIEASEFQLSLSKLTLPHDMAMIILMEALYRASSIATGHPYHK